LSAGNEGNERQHQAETTASNIVHLTEDETGDEETFDEAMARRLQHKYNKEATSSQPFVPHPQQLFHAGTITDKDDEALARHLRQQEGFLMDYTVLSFPNHHQGANTDPTTVTTLEHWIYQDGPSLYRNEAEIGEWLVFASPDNTYERWKQLATAVTSGKLHAHSAKVSTTFKGT
jgi:hypothetical protein